MNTAGTLYQLYIAVIMLCNKQSPNLKGSLTFLGAGWDDWGDFALFHVSYTQEGQFGHSWHCQGSKWRYEKHIRLLMHRLRTDTLSFCLKATLVKGIVKSHGKEHGYKILSPEQDKEESKGYAVQAKPTILYSNLQ